MERYGRTTEGSQSDPSLEWTASVPESGLEESVWQLGLGEGGESYPERPDEADCIYYLRTGFCGYGARCRFNHPRDRSMVVGAARRPGAGGEYPERIDQPVCQYYMRTRMCKFGASCKYHHPRQGGGSLSPVSLNYYGYPLRPGERECSYYVKTGQCKFGATCKFHHPQPAGIQFPAPSQETQVLPPVPSPSVYPSPPPVQSSSVPSLQQYGVVVARPSLLPSSYVHSAYGPLLLSPGMFPYPSWSPYPAPMSPIASPSTQPSVGSVPFYGITQLSPSAPAYTGPYQSLPSADPSSSSQKEQLFPERPGQPECQYYMRTGDCKFGSSCRYHHPPDLVAPMTSLVLSPMGLPLRPGTPPCTHFTQHGVCKFGPACKYDHPMGTLSYSPSASSLSDMPVAPYPVGSSVATLAPSSSSSDLRSELIPGRTNDSSLSRMPSSMSKPSGSVGSTVSRRGPMQPSQSSGPGLSTTSSMEASI